MMEDLNARQGHISSAPHQAGRQRHDIVGDQNIRHAKYVARNPNKHFVNQRFLFAGEWYDSVNSRLSFFPENVKMFKIVFNHFFQNIKNVKINV